MTDASTAIVDAQPPAGSIARTRDREPSSSPTRTTPSTGPEANDSGGSASSLARPPTTPSVSRWPVSVPAASSTASIRNQATPPEGGRAATAARHAGGSHGGSAVSSTGGLATPVGPSNAIAARGTSARANRSTSTRASSGGTSGGRRARGPVSSWALMPHLPGQGRWYPRGINRGPRTPADPTRRVAKPVRVRHSPATVTAPFRGGSPVADPPSPLEPSRERSGASCDPPLDPSFDPEARGSSFLVPPCIRSSRGRTLPGDGPSPPHPVPRPAAAPAGRGPRRLLVAGRQRQPDRHRARVPVARRDADVAAHARADGLANRGAAPGRSPSRTTRGPRSRSRPSRRRSPRSPTRRPRSCSGSASATGSSARSRSSTRIRPRSPTSPTSPSSGRSTSRRSWPWAPTS